MQNIALEQNITDTAEYTLSCVHVIGKMAGLLLWDVYERQRKPRLHWLDSIKEATSLRVEALKETVQDRKKWHMLVEEKSQNRERTNVK
jgi:hypothetical protein